MIHSESEMMMNEMKMDSEDNIEVMAHKFFVLSLITLFVTFGFVLLAVKKCVDKEKQSKRQDRMVIEREECEHNIERDLEAQAVGQG